MLEYFSSTFRAFFSAPVLSEIRDSNIVRNMYNWKSGEHDENVCITYVHV